MDAFRVNPPLPRMLAALPLLVDRPTMRWLSSTSPYVRSEILLAQQWLTNSGDSIRRQLLYGRATVLLFLLVGLWTVVRWSGKLYGENAAWLAGTMWLLNPDVLANSAVVSPDLPAAATGLLACYLYWCWLQETRRRFPWGLASAVALAILCKFSWLFLLVALPVFTAIYDLTVRRGGGACKGGRYSTWWALCDSFCLVFSFTLTLLILNMAYQFDGAMVPLGKYEFISEALVGHELVQGGVSPENTGNRFANGPLAWLPIPIPSEMVRGIDYLKWEYEKGMACYLRGKWQHRGWWYFYLYAMGIKIPIGYWILIMCGISSMVVDRIKNRTGIVLEWFPLAVACIFVAQISSQTGFTHHLRYVLPAYGFLFITGSRVAIALPRRCAKGLAIFCLAGTVWFHATHLGLAHTFFNPCAGGPNNGWFHLSFSNIDWGQSTYRMANWIHNHPEYRPITVLFRSDLGNPAQLVEELDGVSTDLKMRNFEDQLVPIRPGWCLISSFQMTHITNRYFWELTPVAQPYPDVLLFHIGDSKLVGRSTAISE